MVELVVSNDKVADMDPKEYVDFLDDAIDRGRWQIPNLVQDVLHDRIQESFYADLERVADDTLMPDIHERMPEYENNYRYPFPENLQNFYRGSLANILHEMAVKDYKWDSALNSTFLHKTIEITYPRLMDFFSDYDTLRAWQISDPEHKTGNFWLQYIFLNASLRHERYLVELADSVIKGHLEDDDFGEASRTRAAVNSYIRRGGRFDYPRISGK
jgi:hypothetical protein